MARKRYQKGFVYLDGDKWKGRYREDLITGEGTKRIRREVILGCKRACTISAHQVVESRRPIQHMSQIPGLCRGFSSRTVLEVPQDHEQ